MTTASLEDALTGRMEGWALAPVLIWLLTEGRKIPEPGPLITALAHQLESAGAPVWRLRTGLRLIHPQMFGTAVIWQRGRGGAEETQVRHGVLDSDAYLGSPIQTFNETHRTVRYRLDRLDEARDHRVLFELAEQGARDYVIQPMTFSDGSGHFLAVATDRVDGFSDLDISKFGLLADTLAPCFEIISKRRLSQTLMDTYLGHRTGQKVLEGLIQRGDGEAINAALWYSDLRNFTALTDALGPERLFDMLNAYFEFVSSAVTARGGEILSFIGDAMLIIFPCNDGNEREACQAALDSAIDAFDSLATVNFSRRRANQPEIVFGLGLDVGKVAYGNVGAPDRLAFTVIGPTVNRTARLESLTKTLGKPILMSDSFAKRVNHLATSVGRFEMKGIPAPQEVFALHREF
ncbi:adenylate/guanylate cyclase domain-containing protein [Pelagibius sp. Alg239-R121]|uniref:adenylate/guanylate cyclase domain-containing protein n=1 Tax=Pelagibius sp. Alg239-R121 TaxID=2993448 RepID=UPI0024A65ED8|nr:adenylate/guanylate cyclase domain-containing protein [Pelagibius sp. Alg239-R121]